jgi:hypothetical protein
VPTSIYLFWTAVIKSIKQIRLIPSLPNTSALHKSSGQPEPPDEGGIKKGTTGIFCGNHLILLEKVGQVSHSPGKKPSAYG